VIERVADWPFGSFGRHVGQTILPADWAGDAKQSFGRFDE